MKLLQLTKIVTITSLLSLANISCASDPVRPVKTPPTTYNPATTAPATTAPATTENILPTTGFITNKEGHLVPVDKEGNELSLCSKNGQGTCALNNDKVTVRNIKHTIITETTYKVNPECLQVCIYASDGITALRCYSNKNSKCANSTGQATP
ncbi:MAG: hypothetical protein RL497_2526 [Pseudomonadota bacterium]